jgi:MFS family permease
VLAGFVVYEARSDHKSFDVSLFKNRGYAVSLTAVSLAFFALSGITFTLPFYLQVLRGYSTLQAGLCFIPFALGQLIAAPRSARLVGRFGYRAVMATGLAIVAVALLSIARLELETPLWLVLVSFFLFGLGMGSVIAPASTVMQNALPLSRAGAGSAVQNTVRQVFGAFGIAVIGTVLATEYASRSAAALAALPEQAREAASQSIVATRVVLDQAATSGLATPAQVDAVRHQAYEAFLTSSHVTSLVSTAMVVIAVVVVLTMLPKIAPPHGAATGTPRATAAEPDGAVEELIEGADAEAEGLTGLDLDPVDRR